jgi:hypothetical protein
VYRGSSELGEINVACVVVTDLLFHLVSHNAELKTYQYASAELEYLTSLLFEIKYSCKKTILFFCRIFAIVLPGRVTAIGRQMGKCYRTVLLDNCGAMKTVKTFFGL